MVNRRNAQNARRAGAASMVRLRDDTAIPVEIRAPPASAVDEIRSYVLLALAHVETTLIVLIVAIFILFQKEDLRDRLIRLMGTADLHRTTVALDEAAKRLSRCLLSQFVVNVGFGAVIWGGLFLTGVPSPGLWGVLAGLLRFIPKRAGCRGRPLGVVGCRRPRLADGRLAPATNLRKVIRSTDRPLDRRRPCAPTSRAISTESPSCFPLSTAAHHNAFRH